MSRWLLAARLARREVRHHLGRSLLVVIVITLPLAATQAVAIAIGTVDRPAPRLDLSEASADAVEELDPRFPLPPRPGAERTATGFRIDDWATAVPGEGSGPDDLAQVQAVALVADPAELGTVEGRLPRTRYEAVITPALAALTGLGVGDDLHLFASRVDLAVVGVLGLDADGPATAAVGPVVDGQDWAIDAWVRIRTSGQVHAQAQVFELYWFPGDPPAPMPIDEGLAQDPSSSTETVVVGAAIIAIAVGFVAVTCSVAFAIGARRQLRQLGTLAAAGATPADLARAVVLQGSTLGAVGAIAAVVLVYAGRAVLVRGVIDRITDGDPHLPWVPAQVLGLAVLGVVAGTLAALVPALTAGRIPVLAALAGRRPLPRRRTWSPWIGGVVLVGGLVALALVTGGRHVDGTADQGSGVGVVLAVLAVMGGVTAVAPALVAAIARLTGRARGTARLAGRSLSRDRMRSSAVIAAAAVVLGLPVVLILWGARDIGPGDQGRDRLAAWEDADETSGHVRLSGETDAVAEATTEVRSILGGDVVEGRTVTVAPTADPGADPDTAGAGPPILALAVDPAELRAAGDADTAALLASGEVVRLAELDLASTDVLLANGTSTQTTGPTGTVVIVGIDDVAPITRQLLLHGGGTLVDAAANASPAAIGGATERVFAVARPLDDGDRRALDQIGLPQGPSIADLEALTPEPGGGVYASYGERSRDVPWGLLGVGPALLVALAVIGTSLALAAADGRSDDQVVAAVGAPPSVVRRRRTLEATFTAAAAALLGLGVAGAATLIVIHSPSLRSAGAGPSIEIPVLELTGALVVPVAVIGAATWLVLATTSRLRGRGDLVLVDG